ncbi:hypothetical protein IQ270_21105 [Microcoleus sp. LEGE 07076]|uniref:hypothetical protein n=1 Tax=Microcoleus sp. LEGE 07076 TaxID=915322 RepID=UPI001881BF78|nr:hypothetical protein [Microcoleus sp. LEGE 07076]MBE9187085.1 hypothetical protein [Microcoleus sp. LEGE 07076]
MKTVRSRAANVRLLAGNLTETRSILPQMTPSTLDRPKAPFYANYQLISGLIAKNPTAFILVPFAMLGNADRREEETTFSMFPGEAQPLDLVFQEDWRRCPLRISN